MKTSEDIALLSPRVTNAGDCERLLAFYRETGYTQPIDPSDMLVFVERDGDVCAALRLCTEQGTLVLRGMRVRPDLRRQGIGTTLLCSAAKQIGQQECYCIPHDYLKSFYGQIAFQEIDPDLAPDFLRKRLLSYRDLGLDVILMHRAGASSR